MVKYYSLEEAARLLNTTTDEVKLMSRRGEIRGFQDRGSLRFRSQEIDELARQRGLMNSDPDLQIAPEQPAPKPADSPAPTKGEVFNFDLALEDDSDEVDIGAQKPAETPSGRKSASPRPVPKAGSDSDVRLVADGSDLDFKIASDSEAKLVEEPAQKPPSSRKSTRTAPPVAKDEPDSGVRLIGMDEKKSDSDVKIVGEDDQAVDLDPKKKKTASDSDIRLEEAGKGPRQKDAGALTEEIDLDAEVRRAEEESRRKGKGGSSATHRAVAPNLPTTSPFELSDVDLEAPKAKAKPKTPGLDSSDDFELTPAAQDLSPIELGSEEFALEDMDAPSGKKAGDKGISLEQSGSQDELDLEMPAPKGSTPKPAKPAKPGKPSKPAKQEADSSGEFELSLDDSSPAVKKESDSDFELSVDQGGLPAEDLARSEFELSLDAGGNLKPDSDSEFELSLEGGDAPEEQSSDSEFELTLDDSGHGPAVVQGSDSGEKDIFETDQFEVPALDEESGSEAVAIEEGDTDLETSDFDLALGEDDAAEEEPSGSQVVALEDEEEADDAARTVQRPAARGGVAAEEEEAGEFDELDLEDEGAEPVEDEEEAPALVGASGAVPAARPARWGLFPALVMIPTVVVMIFVGIMSWEMLQVLFGNTQGQKTPGLVTPWVAYNLMGLDKPKD